MAKDDQQEAFERVLSNTLARVLDNLKFAETKNAALLTFASAWIVASNNLIFGSSKAPSEVRIGTALSIAPLILAAIIAVKSFLPRLNLNVLHKDPTGDKSLLYFGDIASFSPAAYKQRVLDRYMPPADKSATQAYLDDLAIQVAVISSITYRKFKLFRWGAFYILAAVICDTVVPALLYANEHYKLNWSWAKWLSAH